MQLESKRNIAKYILAFGGVQGLSIAIGVVRNKLVSILLGPNGMGIISLYNSAIMMMQNITNLGLEKSCMPMASNCFGETTEQSSNPTTEQPSNRKAAIPPNYQSEIIKQVRSLFMLAAMLAVICGVLFSWLLSTIAFGDTSRTLHFIVLSPVAALLIIASGEVLVLKAARRLKTVAVLSLWNVVMALIVSVPMFCVWGASAIIPSLVLTALLQVLVTVAYSYHHYPLQISLRKETLRHGMPAIRLGAAFMVASSMTSIAEFLIRSYLNNAASDSMVGLYNVGCMIALTYGGMIFASIDSEYYPRLCKVDKNDTQLLKATVRQQIKVALMFITPMIIIMELLLPWIVPLLFSDKFVDAIPMTQVTLLSLLFRAIYLPIGYIPLSMGSSRTFLTMESIGAVTMTVFVITGFHFYGLIGAGIGIVASHAFDIINYTIIVGRMIKRQRQC